MWTSNIVFWKKNQLWKCNLYLCSNEGINPCEYKNLKKMDKQILQYKDTIWGFIEPKTLICITDWGRYTW